MFGSLHIIKMSISDRGDKNGKGVTFHSINYNEEAPIKKEKCSNKYLTNSISKLKEQFSKVVKRFNKCPHNFGNHKNNSEDQNNSSTERSNINKTLNKTDRTFRCRECEGFRHYQAECPNFMKKKKRGFVATHFLMMSHTLAVVIKKIVVHSLVVSLMMIKLILFQEPHPLSL